MRAILRTLLLTIFAISSFAAFTQNSPTVYTDKPDYMPGDLVVIEGDGWQAGELVKLEIAHSTVSHGYTVLYATADGTGHIRNEEFVIQAIHLGERFSLTATGQSSGLTAQTTFTDGTITWTGNTSTDWNTSSNWSPATVPGSNDDVAIPAGRSTYPVLASGQVFKVKSFTVDAGAQLTINQGGGLSPDGGNSTLNGTLSTAGSLNFGPLRNLSGAGTLIASSGSYITVKDITVGILNMTGGLLQVSGSFSPSSFSPTGGTIEFLGGSQTVSVSNFFDVIFGGTGTKTLANPIAVKGDLTVTGTLDVSTSNYGITVNGNWANHGTANLRSSTVTFSGGTQSIEGNNATTFGSLTITSTSTTTGIQAPAVNGTFTIQNGGKYIQKSLAVVPGATKSFAPSSTYEWQGSGNFPSVAGISFGNLIINSSAGENNASGRLTTVNGDLIIQNTTGGSYRFTANTNPATPITISGNLQINGGVLNLTTGTAIPQVTVAGNVMLTGGTFQPMTGSGFPTFVVKGNWTNNGGTFTPNSTTIHFAGSAAQTIGGSSPTTFNNVTINNAAGVFLNRDITINGSALTFLNGKINTGLYTLSLNNTAAVAGATGAPDNRYVNGKLKKGIASNTVSKTFEIGDATNYTPVELAFTGVTNGTGSILASTTAIAPAAGALPTGAGLSDTKYVNRRWVVTNNGVTGFTSYSPTFTFVANDVQADGDPLKFIISKLNGTTWTSATVDAKTPTTTQATGLSTFGEFAIGEPGCTAPTTTVQPTAQSKTYGENAEYTFSTSAANYQWQVSTNSGSSWTSVDDGATYSGSSTNQLTVLKSPYALNNNLYRCLATATCDATLTTTSNEVSLTVTKKAIAVTANAGSKTFGDPEPELTYGFTPALVEGDAFAGSLARTAGEDATTYPVSQGDLTLGDNYQINFTGNTFTINPAPATITLDAASLNPTYNGNPQSATATTSPTGLAYSIAYNGNNTAPTTAGSYNAIATITNPNFTATPASGTFTIGQAPSVITWSNPADIEYGTALSSAQLNAAANVAGSFAYTPADGSYLTAGNGQTLSAVFTPADAVNYAPASKNVSINVSKVAASISVSGYSNPYDGAAHGATGSATGKRGENLTSLLSLGSSFTDVPGGSADWSFAGDDNHLPANGSVNIAIAKADQAITVLSGAPSSAVYNTGFTVSASSSSGLPVSYGSTVILSNTGNAFTVTSGINSGTVTYNQPGSNNYNPATQVVETVNALKATATVSLGSLSPVYNGTPLAATAATMPAGLAVEITYDGGATAPVDAGSYSVVATITDNNYQGAASGSLFIDKAPSNTVVSVSNKTFNGLPHGGTAAVTGVGGLSHLLPVTYAGVAPTVYNAIPAPVNAGTYNAAASFAGDANHYGSNDAAQYTIAKADATVSVTGYSGTYDGAAHGAAGTATGVDGETLAGLNLGTSFTDVPGGTVSWIFTDQTGNYNDQSGSVPVVIGKAPSFTTVTINGGPFVYTGSAQTPATVSVTGAGGLNSAPSPSYLNNVNAGTATASYSYAGDGNHEPSNDSKPFTIQKADATIVVNGYTDVYNGAAHGASGSAKGVNNESLPGLNLGASFINVPGGTANWAFVDQTGNYNDQNGSVSIAISKATPTINVTPYSVVYDAIGHTATGTAKGVLNESLAGLDLSGTTHTNAGTYTGDAWSFTDQTGNYNNASGTVNDAIAKADAAIVITPYAGTFDGDAHTASGTATGVGGANLNSGLTFGTSYTDVPGGGTAWSFSGGTNYNDANGTTTVTINMALSQVNMTSITATFDGDPHPASATATGAGGLNTSTGITYSYVGNGGTSYGPSSEAPSFAGTYSAKATYAGDANHYESSKTVSVTITQATTATTLVTSAPSVRFMDQLTMTATIKPLNTGGPLTGSVEFKIGGTSYGTVPAVPVPGDADGKLQATVISQVSNLPANHTVTATFTSSNANYSGSNGNRPLEVKQRAASPYSDNIGYYTGTLFAWTTGQSTSTASVTLATTIKDNNGPRGDMRGARVTFYLVNGTAMTPIAGAQNLPVGLVDVNDGSVGTASAIVQLNIGSNNAQEFRIAVGVSGAYYNAPSSSASQAIVTVSKPVPGGFMVCGGRVENINSSGYIRGHKGRLTDFQSDITYTKSGTNPKGKATVMVRSFYKTDGSLDTKEHTYLITTNAISVLNVGAPTATATFTAKANLVEQLEDLTTVAIEGGSTFEMIAFQNGCNQKVAITLYRKAGGVWFSSNWVATKTELQTLAGGQVSVAGGGPCPAANPAVTTRQARPAEALQPVEKTGLEMKAYPNPSTHHFALQVQGDAGKGKMRVRILDMNGRIVQLFGEVAPGQTLVFGDGFKNGVYVAEVLQGSERKQIKLMKQ